MKGKRTYSRKQNAMRWLTRLGVLMLVLNLAGGYNLLPGQAMEKICRQDGLVKLDTIHTEWGKYAPMRYAQLRVMANDDAAVLCGVEFHPLMGWNVVGIANTLDLHDPDHFLYTWEVRDWDTDQEWISVFGFVPDGEQAPTFRVGLCDWYSYLTEGEGWLEGQYQDITPISTIPVEGGKLYLEQFGTATSQDDDIVAVATVWKDRAWVKSEYRGGTSRG